MEEIDLKELFEFLKSKIEIIVITTILICTLGCLYILFLQKPMYSSYTTVLLKSSSSESGLNQGTVTLNKNLVKTYAEIIKSRRILDQVINNLKLSTSYGVLSSRVSVSAVNDTEIIKISVSDEDPAIAKNIADETAKVFAKDIVELLQMDNVGILDEAKASERPYNINIVKQLIIYFAIGFVLSIAILFIIFYFDRTIKSTEQIEQKVKLPILGSVQDFNKGSKKKEKELVVHERPKSNVSEDIRTIRTNLQFTSSKEDSKVILVTSSVQGEGKSFISANLAATFAQNGETTILIDSDLRLGRTHKLFGVSNSMGLSNLLVGDNVSDWIDYVVETNIPDLYVIPRGVVPPNPSELLNSPNTKKLIKLLREKFDHIIFDGVPINGLPDSLILATIVDRVVIASAAGYTKIDELESTKKALKKVHANVAGVIMNKAPQTKRGKYSNYYEQ